MAAEVTSLRLPSTFTLVPVLNIWEYKESTILIHHPLFPCQHGCTVCGRVTCRRYMVQWVSPLTKQPRPNVLKSKATTIKLCLLLISYIVSDSDPGYQWQCHQCITVSSGVIQCLCSEELVSVCYSAVCVGGWGSPCWTAGCGRLPWRNSQHLAKPSLLEGSSRCLLWPQIPLDLFHAEIGHRVWWMWLTFDPPLQVAFANTCARDLQWWRTWPLDQHYGC